MEEDSIFRAAVIAVPIAGGLILIVLILMAVRMLKDDHRRTDRHSTSFIKAQGFIEQHFVCKGDGKYSQKQKVLTIHPTKLLQKDEKSRAALLSESRSHTNNQYTSDCRLMTDTPVSPV